MQSGLPIRIRNTLNPAAPGTLITATSQPAASPVKGLTLVTGMAVAFGLGLFYADWLHFVGL